MNLNEGPKNSALIYAILTQKIAVTTGIAEEPCALSLLPVGNVAPWVGHPGWPWVACQGQKLVCERFPDLYAAIGDQYCPKILVIDLPRPWWHKPVNVLRRVVRRKPLMAPIKVGPNPAYVPGMFGLPDLRSEIERNKFGGGHDF